MELFDRANAQIRWLNGKITPAARWTAVMLAVAAAVAFGYLGARRGERQYVDLMRGVPVAAAQLPAMEAALAKANLTDHEIREGSIHVPRGRETAYMAALAEAGALPPNFGDAIAQAVRDSTLFMSSRDREELTKKATQAELSLMIRSMKGIDDAYVLYDVDKKPGFRMEKLITATVSVKPAGANQLDEERVSAIRHLVAGAIAGLKPEDVTVSDLNGCTWHGAGATGGGENRYLALKRTHEADLKAKVHNALGFIPNVTVEPSVTLDRESFAPLAARVSIGVPGGYFKRIWRERAAVCSSGGAAPDPAALARIQTEEIAKIQRHVAHLLPSPGEGIDSADLVAVTMFDEIGDEGDVSVSATAFEAIGSLGAYWRPIGLAVFGLICVLLLRSILRKALSVRGQSSRVESHEAAVAPAPHWEHRPEPARTPRDELAKLVVEDPEGAANVLRNWIGQAS